MVVFVVADMFPTNKWFKSNHIDLLHFPNDKKLSSSTLLPDIAKEYLATLQTQWVSSSIDINALLCICAALIARVVVIHHVYGVCMSVRGQQDPIGF